MPVRYAKLSAVEMEKYDIRIFSNIQFVFDRTNSQNIYELFLPSTHKMTSAVKLLTVSNTADPDQ